MLHIPEDRLHAYLDQGLERLECVEIESHLAECTRCQTLRDSIAALRDRTTALLARAAPRRRLPPPSAEIRRIADERLARRQRRLHRVAWAASVVAALGVGWGASVLVRPTERHSIDPSAPRMADLPGSLAETPRLADAPSPPTTAPMLAAEPEQPADTSARSPAERHATSSTRAAPHSAPAQRHRASGHTRSSTDQLAARSSGGGAAHAGRDIDQHTAAELTTIGQIPKDAQLEVGRMWRTVSWDGAKDAAGDAPPRIDGLPVVEVQVQGGDSGKRPLMVVAQQLKSGEVIRTIEGPAADVSVLLGTHPASVSSESASAPVQAHSAPEGFGSALALRRGDRMVAVTGSLPKDSLRAMMNRLLRMGRR
ncbi:MAG TPA: zf-HC2 domain-containing protein [Gemmatimonadales bacterium]|nr:zf-HC2 domain-containing protein [Gemmatimonadales bacterium]